MPLMAMDPMHAARLAMLEGALMALLSHEQCEHPDTDAPDEIVVRLNIEGLDIEYQRAGLPIGGEGL
jgi:hypothetical protein